MVQQVAMEDHVSRELVGSIPHFDDRISIVGGVLHRVVPVTNFVPRLGSIIELSNAYRDSSNIFNLEWVHVLVVGVVSA